MLCGIYSKTFRICGSQSLVLKPKFLFRKINRPELVEWSLCGKFYGLVDEETLKLYTLEKAGIAHSIKGNSRITDFSFEKVNILNIISYLEVTLMVI